MVVNACRSRKMIEGRRSSSWWLMRFMDVFMRMLSVTYNTHTHTHKQNYKQCMMLEWARAARLHSGVKGG